MFANLPKHSRITLNGSVAAVELWWEGFIAGTFEAARVHPDVNIDTTKWFFYSFHIKPH